MTARRSRRSVAYAALALGLAGSLALTGCNSHSSKKSKRSSSSSSSKSKKHRIIGGGAGAGAGAGAAASRDRSMCRPIPGSFRFVQVSEPSQVIVKYRNKTSSSCYLYNAPMLFRGDALSKDGSYDSTKPVALYEGAPGFMNGHRIQVAPGATAYATIPTKTASDKGKAQSLMYFGVMKRHEFSVQRTATPVHFGQYDQHPSIGKTAKVSDWYLSLNRAQSATNSRPVK